MTERTVKLDDENLVAFLDGELSSNEAARISAAAQRDAQLQRRLDDLRDSWAMLDELPEEKLNSSLAQTTLEMVALDTGSRRTWIQWLTRFRTPILVATGVLCLGIGSAVGRFRTYFDEVAILRNLPLVIASERLKEIPSREFLDFLTTIDELPATVRSKGNDGLSPKTVLSLETIEERRKWIDELPVDLKQELRTKVGEYEQMGKDERGRAQLQRAKNVGELLEETQDPDKRRKYIAAINAYYSMVSDNTTFGIDMAQAIEANDTPLQRRLIYEELAYRYRPDDANRNALLQWAEYVTWEYPASAEMPARYAMLMLSYDHLTDSVADLGNDLSGMGARLFAAVPPEKQRDVVIVWLGLASSDEEATGLELRQRFQSLTGSKQDELLPLPADHVRSLLANPSRAE